MADESKDDHEEDVYSESLEDLTENDEISANEEAFMEGYDKTEGFEEAKETEDKDELKEEKKEDDAEEQD